MSYNARVKDLLKKHFGYVDFRPLQQEIVHSVVDGNDTLVLMPTGGGKSLCYQLPALAMHGVTLVVSPLIALMKDQVDSLKGNGVPAEFLNSAQSRAEQARIQKSVFNGAVELLYVAPERIVQPGFQQFLSAIDVSLIAVDEAHCISEWGHEFRPDYRNLKSLRKLKPEAPIIALTATATGTVREDIVKQLELRRPREYVASFRRPNLRYSVFPSNSRYDHLVGWIRDHPDASVIVYRSSRSGTEQMVADLAEDRIQALPYHAGLRDEVRADNQERFVRDEVRVIVATVAFGMGIDKPDVRLVAHYEMPSSIERYYQESGRAGRDGLEADCFLFFGPRERERHEYLFDRIEDERQRVVAERKLDEVVAYCQGASCRWAFLLRYFGEEPEDDRCGSCDVCNTDTFDATVIVQKLLSAVIRTGERFGASYISQVLRGAKTKHTEARGHRTLRLFGIVDDYSDAAIKELVPILVSRGLLARGGEYPTLSVTPAGRKFLREHQSIQLPKLNAMKTAASVSGDDMDYDTVLFEELRRLRIHLAGEFGLAPYMVFGDRTLREMAYFFPQSSESLMMISGVGYRKLEDYGPAFLEVVVKYATQHDLTDRTTEQSELRGSREPRRGSRPGVHRKATLQQTLDLAKQGLSINEIAEHRELAGSTVTGHLQRLIGSGDLADYNPYLPDPTELERILNAFDLIGDIALRPVRDFLGDDYSYADLALVRAHLQRQRSTSEKKT